MTMIQFPVLLSDIGGTNARFCLKTAPGVPFSPAVRLKTGDYARFEDAAEAALAAGGFPRPRTLLVGAAGAVVGRKVHLTNANWTIDGAAAAQTLGLDQGLLLNDFETLAIAVPALAPGDWLAVGPDHAAEGVSAVVGPGTGLGVGAVVDAAGRYLPLASEGGHVSLGPVGADEVNLFAALGATGARVPAEVLLAGPGLMRIYEAVTHWRGHPPLLLEPAEIVARALAASDPVASETLRLWIDLLARFCGDMALTFKAEGGVYLAGGILPRLRQLIDTQRFYALFSDHPVHSQWLSARPVRLITADEPAFIGLAALAEAPERYILDFANRFWR